MRRIVVGIGGVVLATLLLGGLATGVGTAQSADSGANVSFGAEVSSFMQASGAETKGELDDGMFDAALNRTTEPDERSALVEERKQRLEERHRELRTQRETLDGESNVRTHAVATRVAVGAGGLERSVNNTEKAAQEAGVDTESLGSIRSNASELRGPDVAELARGLTGPSEKPVRGPPDDVPAENRSEIAQSSDETLTLSESAANRPTDGDAGEADQAGPPNERTDEDRIGPPESERGSPDEIGGTGSENPGREPGAPEHNGTGEAGPPDDIDVDGPSNGGGPEDRPGSDSEERAESREINRSNSERGVSGDLIP